MDPVHPPNGETQDGAKTNTQNLFFKDGLYFLEKLRYKSKLPCAKSTGGYKIRGITNFAFLQVKQL